MKTRLRRLSEQFSADRALAITRTLGFALGGASAVFVAAVLFLLATWDGASLRTQIQDAMRERGRELSMAGQPALRFSPAPQVVMRQLTLGERGRAGISVRAGEMRLGLALWPLLAGRIEVNHLSLSDAEIRLARLPDGRLNLGDLLGETAAAAWPLNFKLSSASLERARLQWLTPEGKPGFELERLKLSTGALGAGAQGSLQARASLRPAGSVEVACGYRIDAKAQEFQLEDLRLRFVGDAWGATALSAEINAASGSVGAAGRVQLDTLRLQAAGRLGPRKLELEARLASLQRDTGLLGLGEFKAELRATQAKQRLQLKLAAPALRTLEAGIKGDALAGSLRLEDGAQQLEARLGARLAYRARVEQLAVDELNLRWRLPARGKATPPWAAQLNGSARWSPWRDNAEFDLKGSVASAAFQLHAARQAAARWQYEAHIESIDPRFVSASAHSGLDSLSETLAALPASGRVFADKLQLGRLRLGELQAELEGGNGRLRFSALQARLHGAHLNVAGDYLAAANQLKLAGRIDNLSLAALQAELRQRMPVAGALSGDFKLSLAPGPWPALARSLEGQANVRVQKGSWQGVELAPLLRQFRPALRDRSAASRATQGGEHQAFDSLQLDCQLGNAAAACSGLGVDGGWWRMGGKARVLLADGSLDGELRVVVQSQAGGPREFAGLRGLTVPLRVQGPALQPSWRLDWSALPPRQPRRTPRPEATPASVPALPVGGSAQGGDFVGGVG